MVNIKMVIRMRKYIIFILIIGLSASIVLGFYLHKLSKIDEQIAFEAEYTKLKTENIIKKADSIIEETSSAETKTTPNTKLIEKIYYNDCKHLLQEQKQMKEKLINKTESEIQIEYIGWEIQKFTSSEVIVYKEVNDYCQQHYMLKDIEGQIIVYALDKYDNEKVIIKETGIETMYLPETDIENLKNGIKVYSDQELNQLLEDFE